MISSQALVDAGYRRYKDLDNKVFYQKAIYPKSGDQRLFFIDVYEFDFRTFHQNGYKGPDYVYETRMRFETRDNHTIDIRVSVEPDDTIDGMEIRSRIIWLDLEGVPYEEYIAGV
jgi:hypothetical protein